MLIYAGASVTAVTRINGAFFAFVAEPAPPPGQKDAQPGAPQGGQPAAQTCARNDRPT